MLQEQYRAASATDEVDDEVDLDGDGRRSAEETYEPEPNDRENGYLLEGESPPALQDDEPSVQDDETPVWGNNSAAQSVLTSVERAEVDSTFNTQSSQAAEPSRLAARYFSEDEANRIEEMAATDMASAVTYAAERIAERMMRREVVSLLGMNATPDPVLSASPQLAGRYGARASQYLTQTVAPERRQSREARSYALMAAIAEEAVQTGDPISVMRKCVAAYDQDARRASSPRDATGMPPEDRPSADSAQGSRSFAGRSGSPVPQPRQQPRSGRSAGGGQDGALGALARRIGLNDEARAAILRISREGGNG